MFYSHFGNGVRNGTISITQWDFINDHYKVNPVGQWGKILVMAMGFVDHLGQHNPETEIATTYDNISTNYYTSQFQRVMGLAEMFKKYNFY